MRNPGALVFQFLIRGTCAIPTVLSVRAPHMRYGILALLRDFQGVGVKVFGVYLGVTD
jgi:hypothetical protein